LIFIFFRDIFRIRVSLDAPQLSIPREFQSVSLSKRKEGHACWNQQVEDLFLH